MTSGSNDDTRPVPGSLTYTYLADTDVTQCWSENGLEDSLGEFRSIASSKLSMAELASLRALLHPVLLIVEDEMQVRGAFNRHTRK